MGSFKIDNNIYSVGVSDPTLRIFDIIIAAEYGTTYNSYLIKGLEKTVLIDAVHEKCRDEFFGNLREITDIKKIDYLIVNHCEPDHTGSISGLLDENPEMQLIATVAGAKYLANILNRPADIRAVRQGDTLELGERALSFIPAPFLHWPDSMFTYDAETKTAFTCDFLGEHYCESRIWDDKILYPEKFASAFRHYYDCIFGPFKPYVLEGLKKLEALDITTVAPSHGVILRGRLREAEENYRLWSTPAKKPPKKRMIIAYASAYGYTGMMARTAGEAAEKCGLDVELLDISVSPADEIAAKINEADAVMIGSNTINRDAVKPVWDILSLLSGINNQKKPAGAFGSFGWSGEAVGMIKDRLHSLRFKFVGDGLRTAFRPDKAALEAVAEYAVQVAGAIDG